MSMTLWPPHSLPPLPYFHGGYGDPNFHFLGEFGDTDHHFLVEFGNASFTAPTEATWFCRSRGPTDAVVATLEQIFVRNEVVQPTAAVRYRVWLSTHDERKSIELTGAIDHPTVEDYLTMHRGADVAPPKLYSAFLAQPCEERNSLYWMTLHARTPTEAFLIAKDSSMNLKLGFNREWLFSIYEGWMKPYAASSDRALIQMPSVCMKDVAIPERPKGLKGRSLETTSIYINWLDYFEEFGAPVPDPYEELAQIRGAHEDVGKDVNLALLYLLSNLDGHGSQGEFGVPRL